MKKQVDPRITTLIRNNVALNHRSFFVLVGDKARDQIVNLHFFLSQSRHTARPNVLWCYKKDLGFTTHRKKREQAIKRKIKRGEREKGDAQDPFELFVGVTDINYCYYKDTPRILGRTFGMLILQDFEAMTPNMLARTIETVEGGGIVVLTLRTMSSLRQLYNIGMDVHSKYRSAMDPSEPVARFNERFLLSLGANPDTLFLDDELNVLPLSKGKDIKPLEDTASGSVPSVISKHQAELKKLKEEAGQGSGVTEIVKCCKTLDQARSILSILDILSSSSLSATVALTAARGRGKSALLGLALAAAVAHGYSNIFVTSPTPENLKTLFEFLFKGLATLGYEEISDWSLQRGSGEWKDVVVRVNIFRNSRQTIQYIDPADSHVLGQAELVVIDEAAAIPLPLVKKLIGPYLVFLSSTINGYEGTGRSLALKLIQRLRDDAAGNVGASSSANDEAESLTVHSKGKGKAGLDSDIRASASAPSGSSMTALRSLQELKLDEPIRYSTGDNIESWLNQLLCLDASLSGKGKSKAGASSAATPHPSKCDLYMVNRDALFSYHTASELFLQKMIALYVSSHYKNSPNDLQLMSDAPSHRLFVLLAPQQPGATGLPEPLAVLQVSLEGNIARQSVMSSLSRGERTSGDLIPWTISQQFQDVDFASLNGVRVVRLAVNPEYARTGYGSRALECLRKYFAGDLVDLDAIAEREAKALSAGEESFEKSAARSNGSNTGLQSESITLRDATRMPALLQRLSDRRPEKIDWLGVSFGLTPELFRFWKRGGYIPLYIRQSANDLTGEYTTVMLRGVQEHGGDIGWLGAFAGDFRRRFTSLLGFKFREFAAGPALSILDATASGIVRCNRAAGEGEDVHGGAVLTATEINDALTSFDLKRLEAFGSNMLDYSVVLDLLPTLATMYFTARIRSSEEDGSDNLPTEPESSLPLLKLPVVQTGLLLAIGLQRKEPGDVSAHEYGLPLQQSVALLAKAVRRIVQCLRRVERRELAESDKDLGPSDAADARRKDGSEWKAIGMSIDEELSGASRSNGKTGGAGTSAAKGEMNWEDAERQVRALEKAKAEGKSEEELKRLSTVVSVLKRGGEEEAGSAESGAAGKKRSGRNSEGGQTKKTKKR